MSYQKRLIYLRQPLKKRKNEFTEIQPSMNHSSIIEAKRLFTLAIPIFFAQLAMTSLGVVDTIMSGWVGTDDLAAIGLGSSIILPIFMIPTGILLAITPLVARAYGNQNSRDIQCFFHQGIWVALPLGLLSAWVVLNLEGLLNLLSLSPKVFQLTQDYLVYIAWGLPGIALFQALRFFWEGLGKTLPTMTISFFALIMNIPLNALFIYGYGSIEAQGAAGCGIATSLVMWSMFLFGLIYVFSAADTRQYLLKHFPKPVLKPIQAILGLGVPNTLALLFEVSMFSLIALFIAKLGSEVLAAHQIALSYSSMIFMVPLSLSMAISIRVATTYGENNRTDLQRVYKVSQAIALLAGLLITAFTWLMREHIANFYTQDHAVQTLALTLLFYATAYQVFDSVQAACAGALRGLHNTRIIMIVTFITYWPTGLGLGYILSFTDWMVPAMGVEGFWLGILLGMVLSSIILSIKLWQNMNSVLKELKP